MRLSVAEINEQRIFRRKCTVLVLSPERWWSRTLSWRRFYVRGCVYANQLRGRSSKVKAYFGVPLCGAKSRRYTTFWLLPLFLIHLEGGVSSSGRCGFRNEFSVVAFSKLGRLLMARKTGLLSSLLENVNLSGTPGGCFVYIYCSLFCLSPVRSGCRRWKKTSSEPTQKTNKVVHHLYATIVV